ncbi:MAG: SpoIIE family protein phosphatase [Nostoc sp. NMS1]|uniref:SpoIIE family protein phosphatase n=1 Tax=unclassified Nostoc TaxID=2593658 RepID=UPI0025DD9760|nr:MULTISPECIES: SpoIIE family protein phosphatase [unclassified Nostoc]MBN3907922.1 SpoIIE family protein phosphatase [Nostoc sp. NMS1]MBN3994046.1 SpoIIE family protein phosphatase [Nostoc sp. NMS2]
MKLQQKTLLIINATLLGLIGLFYTASSAIFMNSIQQAEKHEAQQTVKGVLSLLRQTQENFRDRYIDWSAWDDTYNFVENRNNNYSQANLVPETLRALQVNLIVYINTSNRIVYGTGFDLNNQTYKPIPALLSDRLSSPNDLLLQRPNLTTKQTGILLLPESPIWITSQPILRSTGKGPIRGSLILGRNLDAKAVEQLSRIARLPIKIHRLDKRQQAAKFQTVKPNLSNGAISVQPISEEVIEAYTLLNDIDGKPALVLQVDIPRTTYQQGRTSLYYLISALLISGIVFDAVVLLLLNRSVLSRLAQLSREVAHIRDLSNLSAKLSVSSNDEISELTITINRMLEALFTSQEKQQNTLNQLAQANQEIESLNNSLKSENLRMSAELAITRHLQQMILPKPEELRQVPGLDIVGFMQPADEVGGDYYDVVQSNGLVKIGIGDVTGHGLESGVLMLMTQTAVRTLLENQETNSTNFLNTLNRVIYDNARRMNFQKNLTLALLDYQGGRIRLSGQHEEMLVVRSGGEIERIDTIALGFPLGVIADINQFISQTEVQLQSGDGVVLYTDGITEARNSQREQYGLERLCQIVSQNWHQSAEGVSQAAIAHLRSHIGEQKIRDDITLLVLKQQ